LYTPLSESFKKYLVSTYGIKSQKIFILPSGTLVSHINPILTNSENSMMVILYAGSALKVKNVDKLISAVGQLRSKVINASLILTGIKGMNVKAEWVIDKKFDDWSSFITDGLMISDVCVIPYPRTVF